MLSLPEHGPHTRHLEHQPLERQILGARLLRQKLSCFFGQVPQYRARLKNSNRRAARTVLVDKSRDFAVGIELYIVRRLLLLGAEVDRHYFVFKAEFLEQDRNLVTVRCRPRVESNHSIDNTRFLCLQEELSLACLPYYTPVGFFGMVAAEAKWEAAYALYKLVARLFGAEPRSRETGNGIPYRGPCTKDFGVVCRYGFRCRMARKCRGMAKRDRHAESGCRRA